MTLIDVRISIFFMANVEHDKPMFGEDNVGFFRQDIFDKTGQKFRPLDVVGGRTVILNSGIEQARRAQRESDGSRSVPLGEARLGSSYNRRP